MDRKLVSRGDCPQATKSTLDSISAEVKATFLASLSSLATTSRALLLLAVGNRPLKLWTLFLLARLDLDVLSDELTSILFYEVRHGCPLAPSSPKPDFSCFLVETR